MSDQAIVGIPASIVIGAILLALGLSYIRRQVRRFSPQSCDDEIERGLRAAEDHANRVGDADYFRGLQLTDAAYQHAMRLHGCCSCLPALADPVCPVHQEATR